MQRDYAYLLDMLLAAQRAAQHVNGVVEEQFVSSLLHQDAVIRELEVIGEAARRVSEETKTEHSAIDWAGIIGMRHRLIHDYRNIRVDIVWHVVTREVPQLIRDLEQIVPPEEPEP
jgi:uncharacterized protein with HEPN domain